MTSKRQPSRHLRGYGSAHVALRRRVKSLVESGCAVCSRCGKPISPGERWHLDHTDDRQGYAGAAHAVCNLRAGAEKTNAMRAHRPLIWSRVWFEPVPPGTVVGGVVYDDNGQPTAAPEIL